MALQIGNSTIVSIALSEIRKEFSAEPSLLQWIVLAYVPASRISYSVSPILLLVQRGMLTSGVGRLPELVYGRKKAYLAGTLILAVFTLVFDFADSSARFFFVSLVEGLLVIYKPTDSNSLCNPIP
jgi:MFS family permease